MTNNTIIILQHSIRLLCTIITNHPSLLPHTHHQRRQLTVRKLRGTTAQPRLLLSAAAARMTDIEAAAVQARAASHCLRLTDVAPSVDVRRLLRDWDGQFALEPGREGEVVVAFSTAAARQVRTVLSRVWCVCWIVLSSVFSPSASCRRLSGGLVAACGVSFGCTFLEVPPHGQRTQQRQRPPLGLHRACACAQTRRLATLRAVLRLPPRVFRRLPRLEMTGKMLWWRKHRRRWYCHGDRRRQSELWAVSGRF